MRIFIKILEDGEPQFIGDQNIQVGVRIAKFMSGSIQKEMLNADLNSKGSEETAQLHKLKRAFSVCAHVCIIKNLV